MTTYSRITGVGNYLPAKVLTNHDLASMVETSDEWIQKRTGIQERHIAATSEQTSDLAVNACKKALENAGISLGAVDGIICATTTPDLTFPATATLIQRKLGMSHGFAFDLQAVCAGFLYALSVANSMIKTGQADTLLVVGAEVMSRLLDWQDRSTCVLFGDGAGAVVLQKDAAKGIQAISLSSDGQFQSCLTTTGGPSLNQQAGVIYMEGAKVFKQAVKMFTASISSLLEKQKLTPEDIDWLVPHQANIRIIEAVAENLGFPMDKVVTTVQHHANTSAASIPLALAAGQAQGIFEKGQRLVLSALGAGFAWGSAVLEW